MSPPMLLVIALVVLAVSILVFLGSAFLSFQDGDHSVPRLAAMLVGSLGMYAGGFTVVASLVWWLVDAYAG